MRMGLVGEKVRIPMLSTKRELNLGSILNWNTCPTIWDGGSCILPQMPPGQEDKLLSPSGVILGQKAGSTPTKK